MQRHWMPLECRFSFSLNWVIWEDSVKAEDVDPAEKRKTLQNLLWQPNSLFRCWLLFGGFGWLMSEETRYIGKSASYLFNKANISGVQKNSSRLKAHIGWTKPCATRSASRVSRLQALTGVSRPACSLVRPEAGWVQPVQVRLGSEPSAMLSCNPGAKSRRFHSADRARKPSEGVTRFLPSGWHT